MKKDQLLIWIKRILETQEEEISCSDCFDLISTYVDEELSGKVTTKMWGQMKHHLYECAVCQEEYEILRGLAKMEDAGKD